MEFTDEDVTMIETQVKLGARHIIRKLPHLAYMKEDIASEFRLRLIEDFRKNRHKVEHTEGVFVNSIKWTRIRIIKDLLRGKNRIVWGGLGREEAYSGEELESPTNDNFEAQIVAALPYTDLLPHEVFVLLETLRGTPITTVEYDCGVGETTRYRMLAEAAVAVRSVIAGSPIYRSQSVLRARREFQNKTKLPSDSRLAIWLKTGMCPPVQHKPVILSEESKMQIRNRIRTPKTGFRGVYEYKSNNKYTYYRVAIKIAGKVRTVGNFKCIYDAATAYNFAVWMEFGDSVVYNSAPQPWLTGEELV